MVDHFFSPEVDLDSFSVMLSIRFSCFCINVFNSSKSFNCMLFVVPPSFTTLSPLLKCMVIISLFKKVLTILFIGVDE